MNIIEMAQDAGLLVVLDGRIGGTEYRSVHGTLDAFQRFVHALESASCAISAGFMSRDTLVYETRSAVVCGCSESGAIWLRRSIPCVN